MNKGIVYVLVGKRDEKHLIESVRSVRRFWPKMKIIIWSDHEFKLEGCGVKLFERVKYPKREANRNSSLFRLKALIESPFKTSLYMDNDIYVTHKGFFAGFEIAKRYGLAMAQNPRVYIKTDEGKIGDLDIGADVKSYDRDVCKDLRYFPSMNMGVMFYNRAANEDCRLFVETLTQDQQKHPSRGQAGLYRTIAKEGINYHPFILPQQYLACENIAYPLAIHAGHSHMMLIYDKVYR